MMGMKPEEIAAAARSVLLPDVLTVETLAPVLRLSVRGVRALLRSGRLPGRRLGRRWYVARADLLAALSPPDAGWRVVASDDDGEDE